MLGSEPLPRQRLGRLRHVPQLATVVSSKRIAIALSGHDSESTNALSITVLLDKSFLRNGRFANMTFRILDSNRQFPR